MLTVLVDDEETRRDMTRDLELQSCHVAENGDCHGVVTPDITDLPENSGMAAPPCTSNRIFFMFCLHRH